MIEARDVRVTRGGVSVLAGASCAVRPGELVMLVGGNGAGKSTLARLLCASDLAEPGMVRVDDEDPAAGPHARRLVRSRVGFVGQDPVDQIVSTQVFDEVAFGPRNLGLSESEVRRRVTSSLTRAELTGFEARDVSELSGGELQRLALAGVLAMEPRYLVLDEVLAYLDPDLRPRLRNFFVHLAHEEGLGVVLVSHDPADLALADRVLLLEHGVLRERPCSAPCGEHRSTDLRTSVADARPRVPRASGGLCLRDVSYAYPAAGATPLQAADGAAARSVLRGASMTVRPGEVVLLRGSSGAGKSTLACIAAGLIEPGGGTVELDGTSVRPGMVGLAFQRPEDQIFQDTVYDELAYAPRNAGLDAGEVDRRVRAAAELTGIDSALLDRYPFELSGGQQRRVGLAGVLALDAPAYILDEPTAGLDADGARSLSGLIGRLRAEGKAVLLITHDVETWRGEADRVVALRDGIVAADAPDVATASSTVAPAHAADGPSAPGLDARVKIVLLLAATVALFAANPLIAIPAGAAVLAILAPRMGLRAGAVARALKPVVVILAFTLLANLVSCDGRASVHLAGQVGLDPAGGLRGFTAVARIVLLLAASLGVARTTTPPEICRACVRLLRPLAHVGVPVGDVGTVLSIALRFIPVTAQEFQRIQLAQRARGARFDTGAALARVRAYAAVLTPLVVSLFRRADRLGDAMAARLYTDGGGNVPARPLTLRERLVLAAGIIVCIALITLAR